MTAAAALMLVCAGNPMPAANADQGTVGVIRLPVHEATLEKFSGEPPLNSIKFLGESESLHEWVIGLGRDAATGQMQMLRLRKSSDPLNPFTFKAGRAAFQQSTFAFETLAEGNCYIRPANDQSKGEGK